MKSIKCKCCGYEFSKFITRCPGCGSTNYKEKRYYKCDLCEKAFRDFPAFINHRKKCIIIKRGKKNGRKN